MGKPSSKITYRVEVHQKYAKGGILLFHTLLMAIGVVTLLGDETELPVRVSIGALLIFASGFSIIVTLGKSNQVKLAGMLSSTAILFKPLSLLSELLYGDALDWYPTTITFLSWVALWFAFFAHWIYVAEPYVEYIHKLEEYK
jgi:hypothetical protein